MFIKNNNKFIKLPRRRAEHFLNPSILRRFTFTRGIKNFTIIIYFGLSFLKIIYLLPFVYFEISNYFVQKYSQKESGIVKNNFSLS